jgi:hypothetical protein
VDCPPGSGHGWAWGMGSLWTPPPHPTMVLLDGSYNQTVTRAAGHKRSLSVPWVGGGEWQEGPCWAPRQLGCGSALISYGVVPLGLSLPTGSRGLGEARRAEEKWHL